MNRGPTVRPDHAPFVPALMDTAAAIDGFAGDSGLPEKLKRALLLLREAAQHARDLELPVWEFAVELVALRGLDLTNNDFRWLVGKGYVAHAIEMTRPDDALRIFRPVANMRFSKLSCFVLSEAGCAAAQALDAQVLGRTLSGTVRGVVSDALPVQSFPFRTSPVRSPFGVTVPKWDRDRQELSVGQVLVKVFKVPALNQEAVLAAFEEEKWPARIDDPLAPKEDQDPKRRLHDTINSLNRNQKSKLLRFSGDGSGQGVRWEFAQSLTTDAAPRAMS